MSQVTKLSLFFLFSFFFFNDTATTEIYTLSLHDALPISRSRAGFPGSRNSAWPNDSHGRSEEHTSELQSRPHLVCRLLLEKKKTNHHRNQNDQAQQHRHKKPKQEDQRVGRGLRSVCTEKLSARQPVALSSFFFFNDTATTEIYTLSLHDALPISLALTAAAMVAATAGTAAAQE